jgi:hypothetical protein
MASTREIVRLIIRGDMKGVRRELARTGTTLQSFNRRARAGFDRVKAGVFSLRGAIAALGVGAAIRAVVRATTEQERVNRLLQSQLRATGEAAGFNFEQLKRMAAQIQATTTFGDEYIQQLQAQLLAYRNLSGPIFERTLKAILDYATATGKDAAGASRTLALAINDPLRGMTRLSRAGITLSKDLEETIRTLAETGRTAEAQTLLLDELDKAYGGAATTARDTFGGALEALKNAFGDLLEEDGLRDATKEVEELTKLLSDPETKSAFARITELVVELAGVTAIAARGFIEMGKGLGILVARNLTPNLEDRIRKLDTQIGRLQKRLQSAPPGSFFESTTLSKLGPLIAERDKLLEQVRQIERSFGRGLTPQGPGAAADAPPSVDPDAVRREAEAAEAARKRREAIEQLLQTLRDEAATTEATRAEIVRYKLEQIGATAEEHERARAIVAQIEAKEAAAEATAEQAAEERKLAEARARQDKALEDERERQRQSDEEFVESLREEIRLMQLGNVEREQQIALARLSAEATDGERAEVERLVAEFEKLREEARESTDEMSEFAVQAARDMQSAFADFLFDPFADGLDGMLLGFIDVVRRMVAEAAAAQILEALFPSGDGKAGSGVAAFFSSIFLPTKHQGGLAIKGAGPWRKIDDPISLLTAPLFHDGGVSFGSDEIPALLRRNEEVITPDDPRHRFNDGDAGRVALRIVNQIDPQAVADAMNTAAGEKVILNVIGRNPGTVKKTIG